MYLYRASPESPLTLHSPEVHGYACDYIGGDSGLSVVAKEYVLYRDLEETAVFLHVPTGEYHAAVRVGKPSMWPIGDDWRQQQATFMLPAAALQTRHLLGLAGPFSFYDLVFVLESGPVTPREAIGAGYKGSAIFSLRGHVHALPCATPQAALEVLALVREGFRSERIRQS